MDIENLEGTVENVIYKNYENGYSIFNFSGKHGQITCTGFMAEVSEGEVLKLAGKYIVHPSYGKQFSFTTFERHMPDTVSGIEKYLGSGIIKGIGPRLAKRIVNVFKEDTFLIIEQYPETLSKIKGVSLKKANEISGSFCEQSELRLTLLALQEFDISPLLAQKIYEKYKTDAVAVVKNDPYSLIYTIYGIGFVKADKIAEKVGVPAFSGDRVRAGVIYTLNEAANKGHVYLPKNMLCDNAVEILNVGKDLVESGIVNLVAEKEIYIQMIDGKACVYNKYFYYFESYIAQKILELSIQDISGPHDVMGKISDFQKDTGILLADQQLNAVLAAVSSGVLVITGGPGTGKTTIIKAIIHILEGEGYEICLAAPTGRAAKRMAEATGKEAKTIHRLLGIGVSQNQNQNMYYNVSEEAPIEADVVIVDESSMIDISLMNSLLKVIPIGTKLVLVGDVDQLPSVGPGNILRDIIKSGHIKVVRLNEIFRQAEESAIVVNAHKINNGEYPIIDNKANDFFFVRRQMMDDAEQTIIQLVLNRLPGFKGLDFKKDIQVLSPMRKSKLGIMNLNKVLQAALNPPSENKAEREMANFVLRVGDKVMQLKNNYSIMWTVLKDGIAVEEGTGVFNGDEGIITGIDDRYVTVLFDDNKVVEYESTQLEEIDLSYAVTIHKSQGSEYKAVILPLLGGPPMLFNRNLLYTAVTRAKELCVIVGREDVLIQMVNNKREIERYSSLDLRIRDIHEYISR
ncbi:MAG: ATP-dependent RecD-like DNA helicase [Clostridiales bacterium]|jgi:exodeoxyribonuclease V alpha subunit|nr:ATP-dependent RecD-like DNA helicase [Clostridiales bacterium]